MPDTVEYSLKVLHRLYYSKSKLNKIFPNVSPLCDKCQIHKATLTHSFILCPKIESFWTEIFRIFSNTLKITLEPGHRMIILGHSEALSKLTASQQRFVSYGLIAAKKLILKFWKGAEVPPVRLWISDLTDTLHLERIRFILSDKLKQFSKIWSPF